MTYFLYHDDISSEVDFGDVIAIDTETMGLNINRDRLCLIQLSSGDGNAHLVQISKKSLEKLVRIVGFTYVSAFGICFNTYLDAAKKTSRNCCSVIFKR